MERPDWTKEENHIIELIYSNQEANDKLVLEICKNISSTNNLLGHLIGVMISTDHEYIRKDYFEFLKEDIEFELLNKNWEAVTGMGINLNLPFLSEVFPKNSIPNLAYTYFKRTAWSAAEFLICDDGSHPNRREVFNFYTRSFQEFNHSLNLTGFTKSEIEEVIESKKDFGFGLSTISLNGINLKDLPKNINLRNGTVMITNCTPNTFPKEIFDFPKMNSLNIEKMNLGEIPNDWSGLPYLGSLCFDENNHVFENFDFLDSLPNIRYLEIGSNKIAHPFCLIVDKKIPIHGKLIFNSFEHFENLEQKPYLAQPDKFLIKMGHALAKAKIDEKDKKQYFQKFAQVSKIQEIEGLKLSDFIKLLSVNLKAIKNTGLLKIAAIAQDSIKQFPLKKDSLILVLGGFKFKETKEILKDLNIPTTTKKGSDFTHILIGKKPIVFPGIDELKNGIITEQLIRNIYESKNPKFLQEQVKNNDNTSLPKIKELLFSNDKSSALVGLEMLKSGGVPEDFLTTLLILQKTTEALEVRRSCRKILQKNAPSDWQPLISNRLEFKGITGKFREQDIRKKLKKIGEETSVSLATLFSLSLFQEYKKGLQYALFHNSYSSDFRKILLQELVSGEVFNYSDGLRFKMWRWYEHDSIRRPKVKEIFPFPNDVLNEFPNIKELNFHNCKFHTLPDEIIDFKSVSKINLNYNFLKNLPDCFSEFQNLEHLDLSMNKFEKLPEVIGELKSLKTLDLRKNRVNYGFQKLIISASLKSKLANCKILH